MATKQGAFESVFGIFCYLVCVCFLKIIVCKDDEIPAFSAMMKMGLNCLHLTNWLRERNIFGLVWSPCVKYVSRDVS